MTNRFIAVLLAFALAACTSAPRLPPAQPPGPGDTAASSSANAKGDAATKQDPDRTESAQQRPDTAEEKRSHLTEIGKGLVLVALIALLVWMHYYWAYAPYAPYAR